MHHSGFELNEIKKKEPTRITFETSNINRTTEKFCPLPNAIKQRRRRVLFPRSAPLQRAFCRRAQDEGGIKATFN